MYTLDGTKMTSLDRAYDEIAQVLHFPEYFGRNLDALEECLSELTDQEGKIEILITESQVLAHLEDWTEIEAVFQDNEEVTLSLKKGSFSETK